MFDSANTVLARISRIRAPSRDQLPSFAFRRMHSSRLGFILPSVFLSGALFRPILPGNGSRDRPYLFCAINLAAVARPRRGKIFHSLVAATINSPTIRTCCTAKRPLHNTNLIPIESARLTDSLENSYLPVNATYETADGKRTHHRTQWKRPELVSREWKIKKFSCL